LRRHIAGANPTADYRKYPRKPNFTLILVLATVVLLAIMVAVVLFLHKDAGKVDPHGPNPTPNSLYRPAFPEAAPAPLPA
jgi:flagellar basal body-associated protein FliL